MCLSLLLALCACIHIIFRYKCGQFASRCAPLWRKLSFSAHTTLLVMSCHLVTKCVDLARWSLFYKCKIQRLPNWTGIVYTLDGHDMFVPRTQFVSVCRTFHIIYPNVHASLFATRSLFFGSEKKPHTSASTAVDTHTISRPDVDVSQSQ